jgi:tetratricopeptide (TPR) repeat protein
MAAARGGARISNGEAILASLGYRPVRHTHPLAVAAIAVLALAGAAFYAWTVWPRPSTAAPQIQKPLPTTGTSTRSEPLQGRPLPAAPVAPSPARRLASVPPPLPERHVRPASRDLRDPDDFDVALYHHRGGDFENAQLRYRSVLARNPLDAQARNNLGLLYLDNGRLDDGIRELREALTIDPRYANARINLGVALMRQHREEDAAAEFRAVLAQDPRSVDALVNLALVEREQSPERAKERLLQALGIAPRNPWAHYNLAVVFDQSGEVARAVEHYRSFLEYAGPEVSARAPDVRARLDALTRR